CSYPAVPPSLSEKSDHFSGTSVPAPDDGGVSVGVYWGFRRVGTAHHAAKVGSAHPTDPVRAAARWGLRLRVRRRASTVPGSLWLTAQPTWPRRCLWIIESSEN